MRGPIALAAVALLSVAALGCGNAGGNASASSKSAVTQTIPKPDYDPDDGRLNDKDPNDEDKPSLRTIGRNATPSERSAIAGLVSRYMAASAAGDGAQGCAMLTPSLVRAVPTDYGVYGPPYLRGLKTCAAIMSRTFRREHLRLAREARTFKISLVRVEGVDAYAFLDFGKRRERDFALQRDGDGWKVESLLDGPVLKVP